MINTGTFYKNKEGTANRQCSCGSWKQHWIKFSGTEWPKNCSVLGCGNPATLGAHVYSVGSSKEYIIPACGSCNKRSDKFLLSAFTKKVSANKSETCDK